MCGGRCAPTSTYPAISGEPVTTFVLVHGSWHGPWCWERLIPELDRCGHRAATPQLPSADPAASFADYADVVAAAVDDDDTVLVGHSLAGYLLPLVAQRRAVRHQVYLAALVAEPGLSFAEQQRRDGMLNPAYRGALRPVDGGTEWVDRDLARELLFSDCDEPTVAAAFGRLSGQANHPLRQPAADAEPPAVPTTYLVCTEDRMLDPSWSRRVAERRLGVRAVELAGGHSPFYSRPEALAAVLVGLI